MHTRSWPLVLSSGSIGILLAYGLAVLVPTVELQPGDSRLGIGLVASLFLVPCCIGVAYLFPLARRNVRMRPVLRLVWLGVSGFFTLIVAVNAFLQWNTAHKFTHEGRSTIGQIVGIYPADHDKILVVYSVSGKNYYLRTSGPRLARTYKSGEAINVFYYSSAPRESRLEMPQWRPGLFFCFWFFAAAVLPMCLVVGGSWFSDDILPNSAKKQIDLSRR